MTIPVDIPVTTKNYGFVIDNRKCIGCHACSTACKSENEVPLGVYRTWVKYVESGQYPDTRRHFQVTRCNHCANPPCARICPTQAMYQRDDGIVEFDSSVCIGCKACMQACPYDAIHIDPDTGTAAKCHYCAHRTDVGMEPACVVVCPEEAIISGDMNDPSSKISQLLATQKVTVRKPEQGTSPKLFYIDGSDVTMHPTAVERTPETFMWADSIQLHGENGHGTNGSANGHAPKQVETKARNRPNSQSAAETIRKPQTQGQPYAGPIQIGGTVAEHMVQVGYNAQHKVPWHWPVPAYLVTKGIAAGLFMMLVLGWTFDWFAFDHVTAVSSGFVSIVFMLLTTIFLVIDLDRPDRFLYILLRPQWNSWLARGAVFLIGFSGLLTAWWLFELGGLLYDYESPIVQNIFFILGVPMAIGVAIYTAFLFAQAEGRDLWQSPLLPVHLMVQAFMGGNSALLILSLITGNGDVTKVAAIALGIALLVDLFVILLGEFGIAHPSEVAAAAAHEITNGRYKTQFWLWAIGVGHILPLILVAVAVSNPITGAIAGIATLGGLYAYEHAFVMAPQEVPNS